MPRHELHLVSAPDSARAQLVALTRRNIGLDEKAVLHAISNPSALPAPIASYATGAAAENAQRQLAAIGCDAVVFEEASVASAIEDRLRDLLRPRSTKSGAPAATVTPSASTPVVASSGAPAVEANDTERKVFARLVGGDPMELARADARRRLRVQATIALGIVLALGLVAAVMTGLAAISGRLTESATSNLEERVDPNGDQGPDPSTAAPSSSPGAGGDEAATDNNEAADDGANATDSSEPNAATGGGQQPPPAEPGAEAGEQPQNSQRGSDERARGQAAARQNQRNSDAAAQSDAPGAEQRGNSTQPDREGQDDRNDGPLRWVLLALAGFIGLVTGTLLLVTARALLARFGQRWAMLGAVVVSSLLLGGTAFIVVSARHADAEARRPSATPSEAADAAMNSGPPADPSTHDEAPPGETDASGHGDDAAAAPAPSMAAFVRGLTPAPSTAVTPPFTQMAQALARGGAPAAVAEGSQASEGSGALVAAEDANTAEVARTEKMSSFVAGLNPPTACAEGADRPFGAMFCRIDEDERHDRRRARERDSDPASSPQPGPVADGEGSTGEGFQAAASDAPDVSSADEAPGEPSQPGQAEPPAPVAAAPTEARAQPVEQAAEPPSDADLVSPEQARLRQQEALAFGAGALLAMLIDLVRAWLARRSRV